MAKLPGPLLIVVGGVVTAVSLAVENMIVFAIVGGIMVLLGLVRLRATKKEVPKHIHHHHQNPAHNHQSHSHNHQNHHSGHQHGNRNHHTHAAHQQGHHNQARFCPHCGGPISARFVFCPTCGHRLK